MNYLVQLVGWAGLQLVWLTSAAGMLLFISLRLMRGAPASSRYRCAVLHLAAVIGGLLVSIFVSHASIALAPFGPPASGAGAGRLLRPSTLAALAWTWLGGIIASQALLALRLMRLRRFLRGTTPAPQMVAEIVEAMSWEMGLCRVPEVRCGDVDSPMVAGCRRPFLIVPEGFAGTHPTSEMRALLAHELAHIVRRDYSRNVLQLLATTLVWWHPCAWLIYSSIRHERECASDAHAVRLTGSAAGLANALFRLAATPRIPAAVAVAADSSGLADRITRMVEPKKPGARETMSLLAAAALAMLMAIIAAASSTASHTDALTRAYAASLVAPPTVITFHAHDPAGPFQVTMVRGRVVAIHLGPQPVPANRVVQHGDIVRVVGQAGQVLLRLEVDPRGGLRWRARRAA